VTLFQRGQRRFPGGEGKGSLPLNEGYDACVEAPAGRNVYSNGITKPEAPAERHRNEYVARWGFSSFGVGGYNHVAPTELRNGSSVAARTAALRQQQWGWGEGERSKLQPQAHEDSRTCQTWRVPRQRLGVSQLDYDPRAVEAERGEFTGVMR